jgi:hypothetical protein
MAASENRREGMPPELIALFRRFNALGRLLPSVGDADDDWKEDSARAGRGRSRAQRNGQG